MQLQGAGLPTTSAEALLDRILSKIDEFCVERDRLKDELKKGGWWEALVSWSDDESGAFALSRLVRRSSRATRGGMVFSPGI